MGDDYQTDGRELVELDEPGSDALLDDDAQTLIKRDLNPLPETTDRELGRDADAIDPPG